MTPCTASLADFTKRSFVPHDRVFSRFNPVSVDSPTPTGGLPFGSHHIGLEGVKNQSGGGGDEEIGESLPVLRTKVSRSLDPRDDDHLIGGGHR